MSAWLTKQPSAARPKWRSRATATMYFNSVKVMKRLCIGTGEPIAGGKF
jgi:hypothetical protein